MASQSLVGQFRKAERLIMYLHSSSNHASHYVSVELNPHGIFGEQLSLLVSSRIQVKCISTVCLN